MQKLKNLQFIHLSILCVLVALGIEARTYAMLTRKSACYQGGNILRPRIFKCGIMILVMDGCVRSRKETFFRSENRWLIIVTGENISQMNGCQAELVLIFKILHQLKCPALAEMTHTSLQNGPPALVSLLLPVLSRAAVWSQGLLLCDLKCPHRIGCFCMTDKKQLPY